MLMGFASKFLSIFLTFVGRAIFVRILAVEYLGINGLFADVLIMLSLADLGFGTAMAYSFYKPLAEKDKVKVTALITFYKKIYFFIAVMVAVVGIVFTPFLHLIVNVDTPIKYLEIYYLVMLANTVFSYLFVYKASLIIADQKGYYIAKYEIWINAGKLIVQTIILLITHSYLFYILVTIIATIANNLLISKTANKLYPYIKEKYTLSIDEKKEIFTNMKSVFLYKFSSVLITGTNNILISIMIGTATVGFLVNYNTITLNISSIIFIIFSSLTPSIGNLVVNEGTEKRYEIFKSMELVSFWLGGVCVVCTYFLVQDFIAIWVGTDYVLSKLEVMFILLNFYLGIVLQPLWAFREATGLYVKTKYIMLITALLNIFLCFILGSYFGLVGILAANFLAKISTYFWYEPIVLYREFFNRKATQYFRGHAINLVLTIGIIFAVNWLLPNFIENNLFTWLLEAIICLLIVNVVYLGRYVRTNEFKHIYYRIKSMLSKKRVIKSVMEE